MNLKYAFIFLIFLSICFCQVLSSDYYTPYSPYVPPPAPIQQSTRSSNPILQTVQGSLQVICYGCAGIVIGKALYGGLRHFRQAFSQGLLRKKVKAVSTNTTNTTTEIDELWNAILNIHNNQKADREQLQQIYDTISSNASMSSTLETIQNRLMDVENSLSSLTTMLDDFQKAIQRLERIHTKEMKNQRKGLQKSVTTTRKWLEERLGQQQRSLFKKVSESMHSLQTLVHTSLQPDDDPSQSPSI